MKFPFYAFFLSDHPGFPFGNEKGVKFPIFGKTGLFWDISKIGPKPKPLINNKMNTPNCFGILFVLEVVRVEV